MGQKIGNSAEPSPSTLNYFQPSLHSAEEGSRIEASRRHTSGTATFALVRDSWAEELIGEADGWRVLQLDIHCWGLEDLHDSSLCDQPLQKDLESHPLSIAAKSGILAKIFICNIL